MPEIPPIEPIFPTKRPEQDNKNRDPNPNNFNDNKRDNSEEKVPDPYGRGQVIDKEI